MTFLARVGVGFCISNMALGIFGGGVQSAFQILALSIICTAGLGLVFWVPLWWVVGWMAMTVFGALAGQAGEISTSKKTTHVARTDRALATYIRKAEAAGMTREGMYAHLRSLGWSLAEIEQARAGLKPSTATP